MTSRLLASIAVLAAFLLPSNSKVSIRCEPLNIQYPDKQAPAEADTIRVHTSLVLVPVSVIDATGRAVKNLKLKDFTVLEDGNDVKVEHFGKPGLSRLDIVLVFDVTGSTRTYFNFARQAAASFLKSLFRSGDTASIICIASDPEIVLERTKSLAIALDNLNHLEPFGAATAFFDSIIAATRLFQGGADLETRRVIVVLSDGEDNLSKKNLMDALHEVQFADCIFYSINPGGPTASLSKVSLRGQKSMEDLAEQTGGAAFFAESLEDLSDIYGRIADELQLQYLLGYYSPDPGEDGRFRPITVKVSSKPDLRVRARKGYYARKLQAH